MFLIVKNLGSPVRVLPFAGVGILEERLTVEICESVRVSGEMRGSFVI